MRRVLALVCGVILCGVAGCATPGGVEVTGRASQVSPPPSTPPLPSGTPASADPVAVLRADPELSPKVRAELLPCEDGFYPVDDRYLDLTGDGRAELVVTLRNCDPFPRALEAAGLDDQIGYGYGYAAYVYDLSPEPPVRLFAVEDSAVELVPAKDGGHTLLLIRNLWAPRDDPCCPSDQTVVLYRWDGTEFVEEPR